MFRGFYIKWLVLALPWLALAVAQGETGVTLPDTLQKQRLENAYVYESTGCAAIATYVALSVQGIETTYLNCLEKLPRRVAGNSIREVMNTLRHFGVASKAYRVSPSELAGIQKTVIVLADARNTEERFSRIGHYFVVRPIDDRRVQVLDFPGNEPKLLDREEFWARYRIRAGQQTVICTLGTNDNSATIGELLTINTTNQSRPRKLTEPIKINDLSLDTPLVVTYDLGKISPLDSSHALTMVNHTTTRLEIGEVKTTCGCMKPDIGQQTISPGDRVSFNLGIYGDKNRIGPFNQSLFFEARSPAQNRNVIIRFIGQAE